jgi:hypothetical protein
VKRGLARGTRKADALAPLLTPDKRYIVVRGRLWRATNPAIGKQRREALVNELMDARRAVAAARKAGDARRLAAARRSVQSAKQALGERGPPWWTDGARDYNRFLVKNTPYKGWYQRKGRT